MLAVGINNKRYLYNIAKVIEKKLYFSVDLIIPVTYSFKKYLINLGLPEKKLKKLEGVDTKFFNLQ